MRKPRPAQDNRGQQPEEAARGTQQHQTAQPGPLVDRDRQGDAGARPGLPGPNGLTDDSALPGLVTAKPPPSGRRKRRGLPRAITELAWQLRQQGVTGAEAAAVFRDRHQVSALVAYRFVHGWSQLDAAEAWNGRWPDEPKTYKSFSYWETWPYGSGQQPDLVVLDRLAQLYACRVADLVVDHGDYRPEQQQHTRGNGGPGDSAWDIDPMVVEGAMARAGFLEREIQTRWPQALSELDTMRASPPGRWPDWCLLPSAAVAMVIGEATVGGPAPVAAVMAIHAWRYARSTYVMEPKLASRLMRQGVDELRGLDAFVGLPEWCTYIAGGQVGWPGAGLWAHLAYQSTLGRPELRLVLDLGEGRLDQLIPIPVYLDRPSLTEALADHRVRMLGGQEPKAGSGPLDGTIANLADAVERLVALVAYLAGPGALIRAADGSMTKPMRALRPVHQPRVWLVG